MPGFPSWSSKHICWKCSAGTGDCEHPFTQCGPKASWRKHRCTPTMFFRWMDRKMDRQIERLIDRCFSGG